MPGEERATGSPRTVVPEETPSGLADIWAGPCPGLTWRIIHVRYSRDGGPDGETDSAPEPVAGDGRRPLSSRSRRGRLPETSGAIPRFTPPEYRRPGGRPATDQQRGR